MYVTVYCFHGCLLSLQFGEALKCYRKVKDIDNCVRLLEKEDRYDEALKMIRVPKEALAKATNYTSRGIELPPELMPENLSYTLAEQCARREDKRALLDVLKFIHDPHKKARYMKKGGHYTNAMDLYDSLDEQDEAYRLAAGHGLFSEGRRMARKHNDFKREAELMLHQIHAEFFIPNRDMAVPLPKHLDAELHDLLKRPYHNIKAHATLLLGITTRDATLCRAAHRKFLDCHLIVAASEAFDTLTNLGKDPKPDTTQVLTSCAAAKEVVNALKGMSDLNQLVKQTTDFYGLQKVRDVYLMPPNHNMWVSSKLRLQCTVSDEPKDLDGMLRLQMKATKEALASHVDSFIEKWLQKYGVEAEILKRLLSFKLHDDIKEKQYLVRLYTPVEISSELLMRYMKTVVDYGSLGLVIDQKYCFLATAWMLTIFSPQVSLCLSLSKRHVKTVRNAISIHKYFHERIRQCLNNERCNRIDNWFTAWRACVLSNGKTDHIENALQQLEEPINHQFKQKPISAAVCHDSQTPFAYQYWKLDKYNYHIFSYWLYSCTLIRDERKSLWAAKQAIYYFIGRIAQRKSLSISVINLVNVFIIHSMSIYAMLTQLNHQQNKMSTKFIVPVSYHHCVLLFDALNCHQTGHASVYAACIEDVKHLFHRPELEKDCYDLLHTALSILLGTYKSDLKLPVGEQKRFNVLLFAFRKEKVLSSGAAHHCLVLALTLFVNLIPYQDPHKYEETRRYFLSFVLRTKGEPDYLKEARDIFQYSASMQNLKTNLVQYVGQLLSKGCAVGTQTQALMRIEKGKISLTPLPKPVLQSHPPPQEVVTQQPLKPTSLPVEPQSHTVPSSAATKQYQTEWENEPHNSQPPSLPMQPNTSLPLATGIAGLPYSQHFHQLGTTEHSGIQSVVNRPQPFTASFSHTITPTTQHMVFPPQTFQENQHQYSHHQPFSQPGMHPDATVTQSLDMTGRPYQPSQQMTTIPQPSGHINLPLETSLLQLPAMGNPPPPLPFGQTMTTYDHAVPPSADSVLPWEGFPRYEPQPPVGGIHPEHFYQQPVGYNVQHLPSYGVPLTEPLYPTPMPSHIYQDGSTPVDAPYNLLSEYQQQQSRIPPGPYPNDARTESFPTTLHPHWENISQDPVNSHLSTTTQQPSTLSAPLATNEGLPRSMPPPVHMYQPARQGVSEIQQVSEVPIPQSTVPMTPSFENEGVSLSADVTHSPLATLPDDSKEANLPSMNFESDEEQEDGDDMPSIEGTSEPQEEEEELDEDEGAEEAPGILAMRKAKWPHLPTIDPALIDPSIVTEQFCNICGVSLRHGNAGEDNEEPDGESMAVETDKETYDTHVRSTGHAQQHAHHKKFKELYDGCYSDMVKELKELSYKCEITQAPTLTRLIDDMHESLDKYERKMADRQNHLQWRMGVNNIEKAIDDFQRLLAVGNKQYQKVLAEQPWKMADHGKAPQAGDADDSDTEFQAEINKTVEVAADDFTLEPRTEEAKLAARSQKKHKKRKRKL